MEIRADEITRILREQLGDFEAGIDVAEVGTVLTVGDGIARLNGLERCMAGELLELPHGVMGLALNLEEDSVGCVLFGETHEIREGDEVKRTGRIMSVPVGDALLGRVVNPLGQPLDGKGPIETTEFISLERIAPGVVDRQPVREPLQTGLKAIDAHGPHRPRPARADHRRPPDRQDRHRRRHHHQPEGQGRRLHLRRHRPEAVDGRPGGEHPRGVRGDGAHHRGRRRRLRARAASLHRPLRRLRHRRVLPRQGRARPRASTTTSPSTPPPTARSRSSCAARRAARPTPATSSTSTAASSSARPSSTTSGAGAASPRCRSSRPRPATSPPTSPPTSSPSPTGRSSSSRTSSTPASARRSTSATPCPGSAAPPRSRR